LSSPYISNLDNSLGNRDDNAVLLAAATNVGGDLESSLSIDDSTIGQSLLKSEDYEKKKKISSCDQSGIWSCERTLSVVGEGKGLSVAALLEGGFGLVAGVPQLAIVAVVHVVLEFGVDVQEANVGSEGNLDVPLALVVAGEDGGGGGAG